MRSDARGREQTTAPILLHAANPWLTAISTKPPCTQLTPSSAERARRERRHPKASTAKKSLALDPLENTIGRFDPFAPPSGMTADGALVRTVPTGKGMSGRRPVVKGLVEALRTLRVRSCLRPVGAGNECPAGPDAGPHGSSPNQQNALFMAPALFLGLPSRSVGSHRFAVALDADRLAAKPRSC